jgi:hypothetical protein
MAMQSFRDLSVAQLEKAASIKRRIEELEKELTGLLGVSNGKSAMVTTRRRRKLSAAGRARIAAAAKARWAKVRASKAKA